LFDNLRADFARHYRTYSGSSVPFAVLQAGLNFGFLSTAVYRFGRWSRTIRPKVISYPFKFVYAVLKLLCQMLFGIDISTNADIGPGLYIAHFGGIFLHGDMGSNCSVGQGVTIGYKGAGKSTRPPRIGNDVYIGTSAVIIGDIRIGNNVVIGGNTTVVKDVPDGYVVVSAPARMIPPEPT
jgi:serine O-acetyltransferase